MHQTTRRSLEAAVQQYFAIPADEATIVVAELEPVVCRGGDWLFRQGDPADCMYLLARGRLQVWVDAPGAPGAGARLVGEVGPGEMVGEVGMLTGGERSAGLRAVRSSLLLRMSSATFDRLVQRHPHLMRRVAGGIADRLRERTAGRAPVNRRFSTVALLPLDASDRGLTLAERLRGALTPQGPVLVLTAARLRELGAPPLAADSGSGISAALVDWLASREDEHRFVLYVADPAERAWSETAVHHADLTLLVAGAAGDPAVRPFEREILGSGNGLVSRRALVLEHAGRPDKLSGTMAWLGPRELDYHVHLRADVPGDLARLARILAGTAVGLVLGGGAARGFAHLGVYRALVEAGMPVDWIGGSSIGAIMGAGISGAASPDDIITRARAAFVDGKPFGDFTFPVVSMLRGQRMARLIGEFLGGEIEDLPVPLYCTSSNLGKGTLQVHERGSLPQALRATASLPGVFPPIVINRQLTVDGGILDNLPVDLMRERPVGRVIAVDVTSRRSHDVDYESVPSPWVVLGGRMLPFMKRYKVPGTVSMLLMAMSIGSMESARKAGERADLLIAPDLGRFGFTDVRPFDRIVAAGYQAAQQALAASSPTQ